MKRWTMALAAALLLGGCSLPGPKPDHTRNYLLTAGSPGVATASEITVGVGPVSLPAYLDRSEVVVRVSENELSILGGHRWAESLDSNFRRVLAENVGAMAGTRNILEFPWPADTKLDYRVTVDVERFEPNDAGFAVLIARWRMQNGDGQQLASGRSAHQARIEPRTTSAAVAALSQVARLLAEEIAASITSIEPRAGR